MPTNERGSGGHQPPAPHFSFSPSPYGPSTAHDALPASICGSYQFGSPAGRAGGMLPRLRAAGPPRCIAPNPELDPLHALPTDEGSLAGPAAQQLAYMRASCRTAYLPADVLTPLLQEDAASGAWSGSRRGNALGAAAHGDGVVLFHPHGPLCDRIRLTSVQKTSLAAAATTTTSAQQLSATNVADALCDGSVRQIATCGDDGAVGVAARTDYTVQVWRADMSEPHVRLRPVARRMFDAALLDSTLDGDGLVVALTDDGCLHSAALDGRSREEWATVPSRAQDQAADNTQWEFVTRALQPGTFLTAGARSFGLFDLRAKRIQELMKLDAVRTPAVHDPWAAPTTALCHHQDPNFARFFARATTTCTEVYDHRYLAQPLARWRLYNAVTTGPQDILHFAQCLSSDDNHQPYLLSGSTVSGRVMAHSYSTTSAPAVVDAPYRMPDLGVLSAESQQRSGNSGGGYVLPPRGQLCGLNTSQGLEWLYELDNCGEVYVVPLCSQRGGEHSSSRDASCIVGYARPSVWVQNVDARPVVDNRAIMQLTMDGGGVSPRKVEQTSSLEALARLNAIYAECSTRAVDTEEPSTDTRAAHMDLLRLPRKRPRERTTSQPQSDTWLCSVCRRRQSNDQQWSSLRNHLSLPSTGSVGADRLCTSCAASVEAAMRDELCRRARTESATRKPSGSPRQRIGLCTWAKTRAEPREVPPSFRDPVLAYITRCPRTLNELTAWLRLRIAVAEPAVARFVQTELGALVTCSKIADRSSNNSAMCPDGHLTLYYLIPDCGKAPGDESAKDRKNATETLKLLWNSRS